MDRVEESSPRHHSIRDIGHNLTAGGILKIFFSHDTPLE
jgi:hypothetical protein